MGCSAIMVKEEYYYQKHFQKYPKDDSSEVEINQLPNKIENQTKKVLFQNIYPKIDDYIFDKIIKYELGILKQNFNKFYSEHMNNIISDKKNLRVKLPENELIRIISNEENTNRLKEIIIEHIEKIKQNDDMFKIKNLSILIVGRKGVGKTLLIEYILGNNCNREEASNENFQIFTNSQCPYLRLIEFKGIGLGKNNPEEIKNKAIKYIKQQEDYNDYNNIIHCIWYCISDDRFEDSEITLLRKLKKVYNNNNIPIIVIYTKAIDVIAANTMLDSINKKFSDVSSIKVNAKQDKGPQGQTINPFGRNKLLNLTLKNCTEALQGKMIYIMTNSISNEIKQEINEKNNNNKKEILKKVENEFVEKYNKMLNENEFGEYLKNILKIDILYLFDVYNDKYKIEKLRDTLQLLDGSKEFLNLNTIYENFYQKKYYKVLNDIVKKFSEDFLINQTVTEIQNGNVQIFNKRALKDIEKSNKYFYKKNLYFIFQKIIIKNFIQDNYSNYYVFLQKKVEENINYLFNQDSITNNLSNCFLMKLKHFSLDKNIDIEINPIEYQEHDLPYNNNYNKVENNYINKYIDNSEPFIFVIEKSKRKEYDNLFQKKKIIINFEQHLNNKILLNKNELLNNYMTSIQYQKQNIYFEQNDDDLIYSNLIKSIETELINYFSFKLDELLQSIKQKFEYYPNPKKIKQRKRKISSYDSAPAAGQFVENKLELNSLKNDIKKIIIKEKNDIFIDKIKNKVERLKLEEGNRINYLTIIVIGKSGVGKSTLINAIFKEPKAKTGAPEIQTTETTIYEPTEMNPFFQMIDTRGIELNFKYGPEKIIKQTLNDIKQQKNDFNYSRNYNNLVQCIWYCITGSSIEDKEIEIINKLNQKYNGAIPLILVYTRMISQSNFNTMKEQINTKLKNIKYLIPILAENVEMEKNDNDDFNIITSFGLDELKYKTIELAKDSCGDIYDQIKKNVCQTIKNEIHQENKIFEEKTKDLVIDKFANNFRREKSEKEFKEYIIDLLGINFRKKNSEENNLSNGNKNLIANMDILFNEINSCIAIYENYAKEKIDLIIQELPIKYLNAQAIIEKLNNQSISTDLKKDNKQYKSIIENFLYSNFKFISQKFIIYYSLFWMIIPFIEEVKKLSNEIVDDLIENKSDELYISLNDKKFEDFEKKVKNNN